jgi:hypothetical protein
LQELYEKFEGYKKKEVLNFDQERSMNLMLKGAVWDMDTGLVLKLVEGRLITHAMLGYKRLQPREIKAIYGDPPVFSNLTFPVAASDYNHTKSPHIVFLSFFEVCKIPIICHIVDLMKSGSISKRPYV